MMVNKMNKCRKNNLNKDHKIMINIMINMSKKNNQILFMSQIQMILWNKI